MIILDGGMGNELLKRTNKPSAGLWSAQFLLDSPNLVEEVHQDYINAGAKVITTNTYSTIPSYLSKQNASHLMKELIIKKVFIFVIHVKIGQILNMLNCLMRVN